MFDEEDVTAEELNAIAIAFLTVVAIAVIFVFSVLGSIAWFAFKVLGG